VCLHEATHRLQFTAVPWLRDYFAGEIGRFLSLGRGLTGDGDGGSPWSGCPNSSHRPLVQGRHPGDRRAAAGPEQRAVLDRLLALTTLLEGHADHVMDAVGPAVVPSVSTIRYRFTARRRGGGLIDRILRACSGWRPRSASTRRRRLHRARRAGHRYGRLQPRLGSPDTLPTRAELTDPGAWVRRIHP
jgi:putative hydrolase